MLACWPTSFPARRSRSRGGGVLAVDQAHSVGGHALALLVAGVVVAAVNYTVARLLLAVIRERQRPLELIRREFVAVLPLELAVIGGAITACLLVPIFWRGDACRVRLADTNPTQRALSAPPCAQVVLVARGWAQLTANGTQSLDHQQALLALAAGSLALDAPAALAAAERIAEREQALTEHAAGVPRLHRVLLPRRARQQLLARLVTT